MKFSKEFKEAISHLPAKEKDKLLFRLLKKDLILAKRLEFELISPQTVDERRAEMKQSITEEVQRISANFYSPGYLNMDIRYISGSITEHVKITKDKFGEASLNLHLLIEVLKGNSQNISNQSFHKARKLCVAIIARAYKILLLIYKLHEDYFIDLEDELKELGLLIGKNHYLMKHAIFNGFDVNWLIQGEIPEDIVEFHKDLKSKGYLK